ncbi:MAG: AraC family transcriptional regulator ligand-binding domain-containing protein, partial [Bacteroidota bacterium]
NEVLEAAVKATGDPLFGLHAGENLSLQAAGLIIQIAHSAETVEEALQFCCEYSNLGCRALPTSMEVLGEKVKILFSPDPSWARKSSVCVNQTIYGHMAFTIREYQSLTQQNRFPEEIWLSSAAPSNEKELRRVLGKHIRFQAEEDAIIFSTDQLSKKVVTSDYALLKVLLEHAEERSLVISPKKFSERVEQTLIKMLAGGLPTVDAVASQLNMSVRSFQRKLAEEDTSFKELVDKTRKDFAVKYVKKTELSLGEVAYLLEYSDLSAFSRSFKRWTGMTPKSFRSQYA